VPQTGWTQPAGIVAIKIDPATGTRFSETIVDELLGDLLGNPTPGIVEHFYQEFPPPPAAGAAGDSAAPTDPAPPAAAEPEPPSPWLPL
jgi:penicillin-binding protein 1A